MVGCFGDGSKPILHMDLSCPAIEHIHGETSDDGTIRPNSWGFPMDYGSACQGLHQGQKLHELSIPIVPTNMVICCNSMAY